MKFYTKIPKKLEFYYKLELEKYYDEYMHGDYTRAWNHLERAHIIAQKYPYQHTFVHWKMLQFGFKIKNRKEIFGQIPRLVFGGVKLTKIDQEGFSSLSPSIYPVDNKWGKQGWTIIDLENVTQKLLSDVLKTAYCEVAPKKLVELINKNK